MIGHIDGVTAVGEEYPNIITPDPIQNNIVPYIPKTCANLLLPKPNSDVVPISCTTVLEIIAVFSPRLNSLLAAFFAFFALLKKYFTFFL